jgi:hypothetical protein
MIEEKKIAKELLTAARELTSVSEWNARERNINQFKLMPALKEYRDLLFEMMEAGEISEQEYQKARNGLFRAADKLRDSVLKMVRR